MSAPRTAGATARSFFGAGYPHPSSPAATVIMRANRSKDTAPELHLRSELYQRGLRFRVHHSVRPDGGRAITIDIAFTRLRVAVFVDGCFWHACPAHGIMPNANLAYWIPKLARNRERDLETVRRLANAGWRPIRIWEHESLETAVARVLAAVDERL